jgi:type IV pilus modification protein PilV
MARIAVPRSSLPARRPRQTGFTLIEALIAMLVLAFGMLAVAGLHTALSHSSDIAKQRTEATRLAQAKMEELRAFQQLPAASGVFSYADIASGSDTPATMSNTSYERSWNVTEDPAFTQKTLRVIVQWADRQQDTADPAQRQSIALTSVISRSDPRDVGALGVPPIAARNKQPAYGMPPIATTGRYIGAGRSAIQLPSGGSYIVFNNVASTVVSRCSGTVTASTDASNVCSDPLSAYLISGFISGLPAGAFRGQPNGFSDDAQATAVRPALASGFRAAAPAECFVSRVPTTGNFPSEPGSPAPTAFVTTYYSYVCLVQPVAASGGAATWSGSLRITADAGSLMQSNDRICRLSWDQNGNGTIDINREHLDPYVNVTETLQGQNFIYVPRVDAATPAPCPPNATVNGVAVSYLPVNLIP